MENIRSVSKFKDCYGCGVCSISCPVNAISFQIKGGFYHPIVNKNLCINCGKCLKVCSYDESFYKSDSKVVGAYSAWSNNQETRYFASSGGVIFEICRKAIEKGYKIIGVRYDYVNNIAKHFIFNSIEDLYLSTGSKYIQSYTIEALYKISLNEKYVVIGTPCMISSFRSYIRDNHIESNFILIDFFCHGIPSYNFFLRYLEYLKDKIGELSTIKFRCKKDGWQNSEAIEAIGSKGKYFRKLSNGDLFFSFFLRNRCLNPCCYDSCVFKLTSSSADIRVGDFWGIKYATNKLGINSVLSLTAKGECVLNQLKDVCIFNEEPVEDVLRGQMRTNAVRPKSYSIVKYLLSRDYSIEFIGLIADLIDNIADLPKKMLYYWQRLPSKLHVKK